MRVAASDLDHDGGHARLHRRALARGESRRRQDPETGRVECGNQSGTRSIASSRSIGCSRGAAGAVPTCADAAERNTRRGFLEADQITAICAALPEEVRPVVKFAYATGWRTRSEVLQLEWRNIDWGGRCVRLDAQTKNGEARPFPFTADIETILKNQLTDHERLKLLARSARSSFSATANGSRSSGRHGRTPARRPRRPGKLIHDMRRSAVRTFERAGVPRSGAMSIVGHKTESIYRRYAIVDQAMQREAAARLDAWVQSPPRRLTSSKRMRPMGGRLIARP